MWATSAWRGGVWYRWARNCCGGCCGAQEPTLDQAPAETASAAHPTTAQPVVAFEGGGERSRALGRLIREHRARVVGLTKQAGATDEETAAARGAPSAAQVASAAPAATLITAAPRENSHRQALLQPMAPSGSQSVSESASIRASYRQQLLAQIIESEPLLLGASRVASRGPSCVPSAMPSRVASQSVTPRVSMSNAADAAHL